MTLDGGSATPPTADAPTEDEWPEYVADAWNLIRREAAPYVPLFSARIAERAVRELDAAGMLRRPPDHSGVAGEPEATAKEASGIAVAASPTPTHVDTVSGPGAAVLAGGVVVSDAAVAAGVAAIARYETEPYGDLWLNAERAAAKVVAAAAPLIVEHYLRTRVEAVSVPEPDGTAAWVHDRAAARIAAQALREAAEALRAEAAGKVDVTPPGGAVRLLVERDERSARGWYQAADALALRADELEREEDEAPPSIEKGTLTADDIEALAVVAGGRFLTDERIPEFEPETDDRIEADILAAELATEREWVRRATAVLRYVSAGRRFVDVEPYPDAAARALLGELDWSAGMIDGACTCDAVTDVEQPNPTCIAAACVIARAERGTDR